MVCKEEGRRRGPGVRREGRGKGNGRQQEVSGFNFTLGDDFFGQFVRSSYLWSLFAKSWRSQELGHRLMGGAGWCGLLSLCTFAFHLAICYLPFFVCLILLPIHPHLSLSLCYRGQGKDRRSQAEGVWLDHVGVIGKGLNLGTYNQVDPLPFSLLKPKMKLFFPKSILMTVNGMKPFNIINKEGSFDFTSGNYNNIK